jgi:hypothetical protein
VSAPDLERLRELANAYGVPSTLDSVADGIVARTSISGAANERESVFEVVGFIDRDEGTITALKSDESISKGLYDEMVEAVGRHGPAMRSQKLVDLVLTVVRVVVREPRPR